MRSTSPNEHEKSVGRQPPAPPARKRWWIAGGILLFAVIALIYSLRPFSDPDPSSAAQKDHASQPRKVPVSAAHARKGDIAVYLNGLGSVVPHTTVLVRTRVDGELIRVLFREGQMVQSGDLLAEIDPRPFQVQLLQAEGQLARDTAQLENARVDLERFQTLAAQDSIAKQQLDTQRSLVHQLEGTIKSDRGLVDNAKLQLAYCRITSPIMGRVGLRNVDPGNIVHATDTTGLVTITRLQPIAVLFSIPEDSIPAVVAGLKAGKRMAVDAFDRQQTRKISSGLLLTIDNQIDPTTGTVRCKAEFPNRGSELFPNQFVNARLILDVQRGVTIVPATAIQRSKQGSFVYVVKKDGTVTMRPVSIGVSHEDEVSIAQGISPGELVVTKGVERLREGSPVEVRSAATGTQRASGAV